MHCCWEMHSSPPTIPWGASGWARGRSPTWLLTMVQPILSYSSPWYTGSLHGCFTLLRHPSALRCVCRVISLLFLFLPAWGTLCVTLYSRVDFLSPRSCGCGGYFRPDMRFYGGYLVFWPPRYLVFGSHRRYQRLCPRYAPASGPGLSPSVDSTMAASASLFAGATSPGRPL